MSMHFPKLLNFYFITEENNKYSPRYFRLIYMSPLFLEILEIARVACRRSLGGVEIPQLHREAGIKLSREPPLNIVFKRLANGICAAAISFPAQLSQFIIIISHHRPVPRVVEPRGIR